MPRVLNTTLETIPGRTPYLAADPAAVAAWRQRLALRPGMLNVGLAWRGSPLHRDDAKRSLPLAAFRPLWDVPNIRIVSLQKGPARQEIAPSCLPLLDLGEELTDFADSAALLMNLDLLISVDTAAVHLAGALHRPVWNLITYHPDWRWGLVRTDSPWYSAMRLYRQSRRNHWTDVIEAVAGDLREFGPPRKQG